MIPDLLLPYIINVILFKGKMYFLLYNLECMISTPASVESEIGTHNLDTAAI